METETKTPPEAQLLTLRNGMGATLVVKRDELQAIVQAAYDEHGILAEPSLEVELARAVEAHPGMCRCGLPGCSDGDTVLREFADRWGQSLRGRA